MVEEEARVTTCDLRLEIFEYGGAHTWYDPESGLKRRFVLTGWFDDPYQNPVGDFDESQADSPFHHQSFSLEVVSPPDFTWLGNLAAKLGTENPIGVARVLPDVQPESFEVLGEHAEEPPVRIRINLTADAFEAVRQQAAEAYKYRRIMWAKIPLTGNALPALEPDRIFSKLKPKKLDVSVQRDYAVKDFEIFDTRYSDDLRGRVRRIERKRDESFGANVSVLLTDVRYKIDLESGEVLPVSCEGRIDEGFRGRDKPYANARVYVDFWEFRDERNVEVPEKAFYGEFRYFPKEAENEHSETFFALDLNYLAEDARALLMPIFSQESGTTTRLAINLVNEEDEILTATENVDGKVRYYLFEIEKRIMDRSDASASGED